MGHTLVQKIPPFSASIEEYFRFDNGKHEYFAGEVVAMAGGTTSHARIGFNLALAIGGRLRGTTCRGFSPDLRIAVPGEPSYFYSDLTVVCGAIQLDPRDSSQSSIINPQLIVEILSPSTERDDRRKFEMYLQLESLQEYLLVSQDQPRVERYQRREDGTWVFSYVQGLHAAAKLRSLELEIPMSEIYDGVTFPAVKTTIYSS